MLRQDEIKRILSIYERMTHVERGDWMAIGEDWVALRRPSLRIIPGGISIASSPRPSSAGESAHGREHPHANLVIDLKKQAK